MKQIGTPGWEGSTTFEIDQNDIIITATQIDGFVYEDISGVSLKYGTGLRGYGSFDGADDTLLAKFNSDGIALWRHTIGTGATSHARISLDKLGNINLYGNSQIPWSQADSDALKEQTTSIFYDGRAVAGTQLTAALLNDSYFSIQVSPNGEMLQAFYHPLNAPVHLEANNSLRSGYFTSTEITLSDGSSLKAAGQLNAEFSTNYLAGEAPSALYLQRIPYFQISADRNPSQAFTEYAAGVSQRASIKDTYTLLPVNTGDLSSQQGFSLLLKNQDDTLEYLYYMKDNSKNSDGASNWENRGSANGQAIAGSIPMAEVMMAMDIKPGIWSEEPPDNFGLSTLATDFDSLPSWIAPGTFTQSNVYSIAGGKLNPSKIMIGIIIRYQSPEK